MKYVLRGVAQILFVAAGLSFLWGGRAISEFTKTERIPAEIEGIGLAFVTGALGFLAKNAADDVGESKDSPSK